MGERKVMFFDSGRIRTLVAKATYSSHRLIMGKSGNLQFFSASMEILGFFLQKCLLSTVVHYVSFNFCPNRCI